MRTDPPEPDSDDRRAPNSRENWIAVVVLGFSLTVTGVASQAIELSPVLTILLVVSGLALLLAALVGLQRSDGIED
jgi:ABC-type multidrug transport system permease subunit